MPGAARSSPALSGTHRTFVALPGPVWSFSILSVLSGATMLHPALHEPARSCPTLSWPTQPGPTLSSLALRRFYTALPAAVRFCWPCQVLSGYTTQPCPSLSNPSWPRPVHSGPVWPCPALSGAAPLQRRPYPAHLCPVLSGPVQSSPTCINDFNCYLTCIGTRTMHCVNQNCTGEMFFFMNNFSTTKARGIILTPSCSSRQAGSIHIFLSLKGQF